MVQDKSLPLLVNCEVQTLDREMPLPAAQGDTVLGSVPVVKTESPPEVPSSRSHLVSP